ncbi:MAG: antibiotic biosynthesis monooxygenase [Ilumatobacter sp.]|uniref:putative quinol monooxygenase n=1 Tax=Ilumatobacter sp. TaxID=1967498 RepID=UPI003299B16D
MATLLAHITVRSGSEARFEEIARELYAKTHADEPDVLRYEYWRGADERTYYSLLSFPDHRGFIVHQTSDHHEVASPLIGAVVESIRLEWVDPLAGASDLASTEAQDAPEGADELTMKYTERFAAEVADWWLALR